MVKLILKVKNDYNKLPNSDEFKILSEKFLKHSKLKNTVLVVDGTHVKIKNPANSNGMYINRKKESSLNFMLVGDSDFKIRYILGGSYGSSHDACMFSLSDLEIFAKNNLKIYYNSDLNLHNYQQYHILGDSAYPGREYMKTLVKGELTIEDQEWNDMLIPQRQVIERIFGYFKGKFQKFRDEIDNLDLDFVSKLFFASVIIYNITIKERISVELEEEVLRIIESNEDNK
ncbi:HARB1 [Hepatospora eriocheir]|uniref:HARB1 n=1 Tax=Hepatospora eriocheir TaxID=1081669 RepID=A0A1X0Q9D6_9MICR|nr:HARB1 [Hepatospora eriocheir]